MSLAREMIEDMAEVNELYRPTNFWQTGLKPILDDLERTGVESFRKHPSATKFYAPIYGFGKYSERYRKVAPLAKLAGKRISRALDNLMSGKQAAFDDYRLFQALDAPGGIPLQQLEESPFGGGQRFTIDGKRLGRSFLNYLRGVAFLKQHVSTDFIKNTLEIGGGYGTLGEVMLKADPDAFYMNVDIPPVAAVSTWYLSQVFGEDAVFDYRKAKNLETIDLEYLRANYRAAILCPWQLERVTGQFDLFANFISFQEMEPAVVENYVAIVKRLTSSYVLLRNSMTGKPVAGAGETGVFEPTTTDRMSDFFAPEFEVIARDAYGAGHIKLSASLTSEAIILKR